MSVNANSGLGTTLSWAGNVVAEVLKIGDVELSADPIEVTDLSSTSKQFIPNPLMDSGDVSIEGNFYPGDTNGQIVLKNAVGAASQAVVITFPTAFGANWSFTGLVSKFSAGSVDKEGIIPFKCTIKIVGAPTMNITASTGLTTPFMTASVGTFIPAAAQAVLNYVLSVVTGTTGITITPTASAGVITITANGVSQVVTSGQASTTIALGAAGSITVVTMTVKETNKQAKTYTINVARA